MKLLIEKSASRGLDKMSSEARKAMIDRLHAIAASPFAHHANVKPMSGRKGAYRLRQGAWRAVYDLDRETQTMYVLNVGTRGSIYR